MKHLILSFVMLMASSSILAIQNEDPDLVHWKGGNRPIINNIQVNIWNNTVTTTFLKDAPNATITVKKKTGEVIQTKNLNAKTFDQVPMKVENYQKEKYIIEIRTTEGKAEGEF